LIDCYRLIRPIAIMNRSLSIDSNYALDSFANCLETYGMEHAHGGGSDKLQMLVLERRDPGRNMARYYVLAIEPTLFGDMALVREWGRLGCRGRRRLDLHSDAGAAAEALEAWFNRKRLRGYSKCEEREPARRIDAKMALDRGQCGSASSAETEAE
jgi:predicted DNA-binding WGR domain protein